MCAANAEEKMAMQMPERNCVQYSDECPLMKAVQKMFQRNFGLNPQIAQRRACSVPGLRTCMVPCFADKTITGCSNTFLFQQDCALS
jgi:hypothetical protein